MEKYGKHQDIEWTKISGLRNILVHDYLGVDLETVWNIIATEFPQLKDTIKDYIPETSHLNPKPCTTR